jgi:hypothetical protein
MSVSVHHITNNLFVILTVAELQSGMSCIGLCRLLDKIDDIEGTHGYSGPHLLLLLL